MAWLCIHAFIIPWSCTQDFHKIQRQKEFKDRMRKDKCPEPGWVDDGSWWLMGEGRTGVDIFPKAQRMTTHTCAVASTSSTEWVISKENKIKFMTLREIRVMGGGGGGNTCKTWRMDILWHNICVSFQNSKKHMFSCNTTTIKIIYLQNQTEA